MLLREVRTDNRCSPRTSGRPAGALCRRRGYSGPGWFVVSVSSHWRQGSAKKKHTRCQPWTGKGEVQLVAGGVKGPHTIGASDFLEAVGEVLGDSGEPLLQRLHHVVSVEVNGELIRKAVWQFQSPCCTEAGPPRHWPRLDEIGPVLLCHGDDVHPRGGVEIHERGPDAREGAMFEWATEGGWVLDEMGVQLTEGAGLGSRPMIPDGGRQAVTVSPMSVAWVGPDQARIDWIQTGQSPTRPPPPRWAGLV